MRDQAHRQNPEGETVVSQSANCLLFPQRKNEQPSAAERRLRMRLGKMATCFASSIKRLFEVLVRFRT